MKKLTFAPVLSILDRSRATLSPIFLSKSCRPCSAELARLYPWLDGMTPICCKKPSTSFSDHFSSNFPLAIRWIVIDVIFRSLPVRGAPGRSPSCFPIDVSRDNYFISIGNLLFDAVRTRSRLLEHAEDLLQPLFCSFESIACSLSGGIP